MSDDKLIHYLINRIEKIDEKVDQLLHFKWQIIGGSVVISILVAGVIHILALVLGK